MSKTTLLIALLIAATTSVLAQTAVTRQTVRSMFLSHDANNLCAEVPSPRQIESVEQAVLKATQDWLAADERQDRAALNKIIADDFVGTGPMGTTVSKGDVIPREGTGNGHGLSISGQDIKARVFGDTAIVTGRGVPKTQQNERPEMRFTVVFVKRAGNWQMVGAHLSGIPRE
jgi:ketosteroid isomerase-like protein